MLIIEPSKGDLRTFDNYKAYKARPGAIGWHFNNLDNQELQNLATATFGTALKPLVEISRDGVIEELLWAEYFERKEG